MRSMVALIAEWHGSRTAGGIASNSGANRSPSCGEPEVDDVAVLHHVVHPLEADLTVVAALLRKPPPEVRIVGLRVAEILAA